LQRVLDWPLADIPKPNVRFWGVKRTLRALAAMAANEGHIREKYGLPA